MNSSIDCPSGNGLIVNSTCYTDGRVEYSWHSVVSIDEMLINYNCTGNTEEHVRLFNNAYTATNNSYNYCMVIYLPGEGSLQSAYTICTSLNIIMGGRCVLFTAWRVVVYRLHFDSDPISVINAIHQNDDIISR